MNAFNILSLTMKSSIAFGTVYILTMGRQRAPDWNCFHQGCGSGSGLDPDPGARKIRNFSGKIALFSYCFKKFYN
jgi:hypothetical protein